MGGREERRVDLRLRTSALTQRPHCWVISFHFAQVFILVIDNNLKGVVAFGRMISARRHSVRDSSRRLLTTAELLVLEHLVPTATFTFARGFW